MKKLSGLVLAGAMLGTWAQTAQAYIVANFDRARNDERAVTHVFVIGYAHGVGTQFFEAAVARAQRYRQLYPNNQIVFFRNRETYTERDMSELRGFGVQVLEAYDEEFSDQTLLRRLDRFRRIATIDFYAHSGVAYGIGLDDTENGRLDQDSERLDRLRNNFVRDAYATINGCNAGYEAATVFSNKWRIPVAGAFTGTDFQQFHNDGLWYFNNPGEFPAGGWRARNNVSFDTEQNCRKGRCIRMKPINAPYRGMWGSWDAGGLGFYKFFCNYQGDLNDCYSRMARALLGFPTLKNLSFNSSMDDFKVVVQDYLCPNNASGPVRDECMARLAQSESGGSEVYSPFRGNSLECTMNRCNAETECQWDRDGNAIPGSCAMRAPHNDSPKTMIQEYKRFVKGFGVLQRQMGAESFNYPLFTQTE